MKKLSIILSICLILIFSFTINCFAETSINYDFILDDSAVTSYFGTNEDYKFHYVIVRQLASWGYDEFAFVIRCDNLNFYNSFSILSSRSSNDTYDIMLHTPDDTSHYSIVRFSFNPTTNTLSGATEIDFNSHYKTVSTGVTSSSDVFGSSTDIYLNSGELFFQRPLLEKQTILVPIVEKVETQKTLQEVVEILPLILVVVVSLVGLRKALAMLSTVLHRS